MKHPDQDWKYLPVSRVMELLSSLPGDMLIVPNAVGNLAVMVSLDTSENMWGFINFSNEGKVEQFHNYEGEE